MSRHIFWFTHDLRLDDNRALIRAASSDQLLCVYVVDPTIFEPDRYGIARMGKHHWRFICETLVELDKQLDELGQRLHIAVGEPTKTVLELVKTLRADRLICSEQVGFDERRRLDDIRLKVECELETAKTFTLFESEQGEWLGSGLSKSFSKFRRDAEKHDYRSPVQSPSSLPPRPAVTKGLNTVGEFISQFPPIKPTPNERFLGGDTEKQRHLIWCGMV